MPTFTSLMTDTYNFIKNHFMTIILVIVGVSVLTQLFTSFFYPSTEIHDQIKSLMDRINIQQGDNPSFDIIMQKLMQLSEMEKKQFVAIISNYAMKCIFIMFINSLIILSCICSLIGIISINQFSWSNFFTRALRLTPQILLISLCAIPYFIVISIIISLIPFLAQIILIVSIVFFMLTYIVFLAIITTPNLPESFTQSLITTLNYLKQQTPMVLLGFISWLVGTLALSMVFNLFRNNFIFQFIESIANNLLVFALFCYLYRLYSLTKQVSTNDSSH